jgi:hypothetical protein
LVPRASRVFYVLIGTLSDDDDDDDDDERVLQDGPVLI